MGLSRYVPALIQCRVLADPTPLTEAIATETRAAVFFADISGFTRLTEMLAERGPAGVERLSRYLNEYFGRLINMVHAHGGDIVKFAGDALLALWEPGEGDEGLPDAVRRAAHCALAVQEALAEFNVGDEVRLAQRIGIGAGTVHLAHVGGVLGRWEFFVAGEPVEQIEAAHQEARPGEVVVAPAAWALIDDQAKGDVRGNATHLLSVRNPLPTRSLELLTMSDEAEEAMRVYVAGSVLTRVDAAATRWLAELRRITVLFVNLPLMDLGSNGGLATAQQVTQEIQNAVYRWEGSIDKISVDDKGATLLAGFGLPPLSHEDDAARALRAALAIETRLQEMGLECSVGVATGRVFCGTVGNDARCEYTVIGSAVNLASRLMQQSQGRICCDTATYQSAKKQLIFEELAPVRVRGWGEPVPVFRPTGEERRDVVRAQTEIVGRTGELAQLSEVLQGLVRQHADGLVFIEGEAGIGKSRLVAELIHRSSMLRVRAIVGAALAIERSTAYYAWRPIFEALFDVGSADGGDTLRARVEGRLSDDEKLRRLVPLLSAVLPLDIPDNEHTGGMTGEVRADNTNHLLTRVLQREADEGALLLVLEDVHWMDSASWALAQRVVREVDPLMLVVATRPLEGVVPPEYTALSAAPTARRLLLERLSPEDTVQLVCQRLGVAALPEQAAALIRRKAGGNPFFSEEIAYSLRDGGQLVIKDGRCLIAEGSDLDALELPDTVQDVVISRVDRLTPTQQLTLKVASVVGREFPLEIVEAVYPDLPNRTKLADGLPELVELDIIRVEMPGPRPTYIFKHVITQEAVYGLMLFAQRRELHKSVADWYERVHGVDAAPYFPLLAHHFGKAEEREKAVEYLRKAGDQAQGRFANHEALGFYEKALTEARRFDDSPPVELLAHLEQGLTHTCHDLGRFDECKTHGIRALKHMGRPVPSSAVGLALGLLGQVILRIREGRRREGDEIRDLAEKRLRLSATRVHNRLSEIAVFREEALMCLYSGLRELNLSQGAGPTPELGRAYTLMCIVLGTVPLRRIADNWLDRSLRIAETIRRTPALGYIYSRCAVYGMYVARWEDIQRWLDTTVSISEQFADRRLKEEASSIYGLATYYTGRFAESYERWSTAHESTLVSGNPQIEVWSQMGRGHALARLGRADEGIELFEAAREWIEASASQSEAIWYYGTYAMCALRADMKQEARSLADRALLRIQGSRPVAYWTQQGLVGACEVFLGLLEDAKGNSEQERSFLEQDAKRALKGLKTFGGVHPFGKPYATYFEGVLLRVTGHPAKARRVLQRCLALATKLKMPYEQGLANLELARCLPRDDGQRAEHLAAACEFFERLESTQDLASARREG